MGQELDDGVFWLPSEFLTDDGGHFADYRAPRLVPPVNGFGETERDEDDVVLKAFHQNSDYYTATRWKMYGNGSSRESTLSTNWDFIYAAAEELASMKMAAAPPPPPPFRTYKPQIDARLVYLRLQLAQRMKQQRDQMMMMMKRAAPAPETCPYPPISAALKTERNGTGVFLPRHFSTATDTRKKPVHPERSVQNLNPNMKDGLRGATPKRVFPIAAANQEIRLPKEWIY